MSVLDGPRRELRRIVLGGRVVSCRVEGEQLVLADGTCLSEANAVYVPPCEPHTIVCVHLNYRSRAIELGAPLEGGYPTYFLKPVSALSAHRAPIVVPSDCELLNYEGEIAAVVGRTMKRVRPDDVWEHLAGFCCANDVGAHDFRDTDSGSMLRVKGQDGFCPLGPSLVSGIDIRKAVLRTYVNGQRVQEGAVADMLWGIDHLLADITRHVTLQPGDVVLSGTPWHSRPMFPGDVVEVEVSGIGRLINHVERGAVPASHRGFPATVTKTSLGVALGSDYHVLKKPGAPPTSAQYRSARAELIAMNMERGPRARENTP